MRPTNILPLVLGIALLLPLAACGGGGGGGGGDDTPDPVSISIRSEETLDGRVGSDGFVDLTAPFWNAFTGDRGASIGLGHVSRQLYAFHMSAIPAGATVISATLRVYQVNVEGAPYAKRGNVVVDHVDYVGRTGPDTYDAQDITRDVVTLSTTDVLGWKTADVTSAVQASLTRGDTWNQYRLRFWKPGVTVNDPVDDYANFIDGENDDWIQSGPPTLEIVYQP